ncbi:2-hydroxycarboxylate transporter family protein [Bradyrhizobium sp. USDA 4486]
MTDTTMKLDDAAQPAPSSALAALRIGPLPITVYVAAALVCAAAIYTGKLPNDVIGGLSVLMLLGFLLGKLGQTIPVLKRIGGTAILCLFVPAALVSYGLMPEAAHKAITTTFRTANFQYFFIACLVAGSILGMPHRVLVQGFIRMFVPLLVGTLSAIAIGMAVGLLFGHSPKETFFFVIIPIIGGGLAEGVLPLSIAYAEMLHRPQGELVAQMVPAALLGNVVAIVAAGLLARLGGKTPRPQRSGHAGQDRRQ